MTDLGRLRRDLVQIMESGGDLLAGEDAFNALALRIFQVQCAANPVYGRFVSGRGIDPSDVGDWRDIPPVPTGAFRSVRLVTGGVEEPALVFRTSGTSRGRARRGEHVVADPDLYRASLLPPFRKHVLPDGIRPVLTALLPPPGEVPDSSLGFMVDVVMSELSAPGGGWFMDAQGRLDGDGLVDLVHAMVRTGTPMLMVGTAFAWVHTMDDLDGRGVRLVLPPGSRIMETGGFKGRSRTVPRGDLYAGLVERLGVPLHHIVNEYGMTELLSQFYEPVLSGQTPADPDQRHHVAPPWVRTRILHPETLEPVAPGEVGLLCHLDLANLRSVSAVLTEDLGVEVGDGFRVLGRAPGAEPRGCSLIMEELLDAPGGSG